MAHLLTFSPTNQHYFSTADSDYVVTQRAGIHIEDLAPLLVSPDVADRFYKYKGSITTPGCYESVTWFVMNNHPQISEIEVSNKTIKKIRPIEKTFTDIESYILERLAVSSQQCQC